MFTIFHPAILDGTMKIGFVTNKTNTNPTVRFHNRQTPEYGYYYSCLHCYDLSKSIFRSIDDYERHIVIEHRPGTVGYPGPPDIEKLEVDKLEISRVTDIAVANLIGNGLLHKGEGDT